MPLNKTKKLFIVVLVTIFIFAVMATTIFLLAKSYINDISVPVKKSQASVTAIAASFQNRDLVTAKTESKNLSEAIGEIDAKYAKINSLKNLPFLKAYFSDGQHVIEAGKKATQAIDNLILAIEPYSELIGFKTDSTTGALKAQSIEDKIVFLADTLNKIAPQLDTINTQVEAAKAEIDQIDPSRYPETFMGKSVRSKIIAVQSSVAETAQLLAQSRPLMKLMPDLLGNPNPKLYMLLFQNDAELRPTGGFMTAYAYIKVTKGKIEPLGSYDIYDLDARWNRRLPAPLPIKKFLPLVDRWNLRDMNLSPDFKTSMDTFSKHLREIGNLPSVDGIIALDTQFPVELLKVIGPIGVGGWGNFSANIDPRCDCPQVVYALEEIADRPTNTIRVGRKAVLGPLMHSMMANAMGSPKSLWPRLFNVGLDAITQKHILFYFNNESSQESAAAFNATGEIKPYDFDYLMINDSNFGGAKTDMFIDREVDQEIVITDGKVTKTVTLTYNNPHKGSNCNLEAGQLCLNGTYRDWVRLYVPKGSKLISVVGSEVKEVVSEDLGKTVIEAFFTMRPQSGSKLVFTYELPDLNLSPYKILIQKQPGKPSIKYNITLNGKPTVVDLNTDRELTL